VVCSRVCKLYVWETAQNQLLRGDETNVTVRQAEGRIFFVFCTAVAGGAIQDLGSVQRGLTYSQVPPVLGLMLQANRTKRLGKKGLALPRNGEARLGGMACGTDKN